MTNAERFIQVFGFRPSKLLSMSDDEFNKWLYEDAPELRLVMKPITNSEILERLKRVAQEPVVLKQID